MPLLQCGPLSLALTALLAASLLWPPAPLLLWNVSSSSTVGLYAVTPARTLQVGDMVVAWPPLPARRLAAARAYLPFDVPLVKRVAAVAGDRICAQGRKVFVNGQLAAVRQALDPSGRPMPWWSGCARLGPGELFMLSSAGPLAFYWRYFGITRAPAILGRARLLLARTDKSHQS